MIVRSGSFKRLAFNLSLGTSLVIASLALGGCMQSTNGSGSSDSSGEPDVYVYKGRKDPLMDEPVANRTAKLSERFKLVQARQ